MGNETIRKLQHKDVGQAVYEFAECIRSCPCVLVHFQGDVHREPKRQSYSFVGETKARAGLGKRFKNNIIDSASWRRRSLPSKEGLRRFLLTYKKVSYSAAKTRRFPENAAKLFPPIIEK